MPDHEPENRKHHRAPAAITAALVVAMFVAYVLSAGPVGWMIIRQGRPQWMEPYFESAYAPAFWLQSKDRTRLLNAYYKWWWG